MKKISLFLFLLLTVSVAFAQKDKTPTPKIEKSKILLDKGEVVEAKQIIDDAIVHEKTIDKVKTWYYRGLIYEAIYNSEDQTIQDLSDDAFGEATNAYLKVKELENETGTYFIFADQRITALYSAAFNAAAEAYQSGDYEGAIEYFSMVKMILPNDTAAWQFSGYAAQQLENNELALENFNYLADHGMADVNVHRNIIYMYRSILNDTTAALEAAERARTQFPDDHDLKQDEITLLIMTHQIDEAKQKLTTAIENDPDNHLLYYEMGYIYDATEQYDEASKWYERCLEKNPEYFEALYNLGVNKYNQGADILKVAQDMDLETYKKEGKAVEARANEVFILAVPYFERAHEVNPEDIDTLQTLRTLYALMKDYDKVDEVEAKLSALGITQDEEQ
jgi:tetratricopeptide (TPR) repeat protein